MLLFRNFTSGSNWITLKCSELYVLTTIPPTKNNYNSRLGTGYFMEEFSTVKPSESKLSMIVKEEGSNNCTCNVIHYQKMS